MARRRRTGHSTIRRLLSDVVTLIRLALTPRARLAAENLFLRKQLALYHERGVRPRRSDHETRAVLVLLSRLMDWRSILTSPYGQSTIRRLLSDVVTLIRLALTPRARLAAENLFLRKQLALYNERSVKPRRSDLRRESSSCCSHGWWTGDQS